MDAQESAGEPKAGRDEAEGLGSLPLATVAAVGETTPMEGAAAADLVNPVDEHPERGEPSEAEEEIERIMEEVEGEGQKPDQAEEGGDGSDDFGVDFARDGTDVAIVAVLVDEVANHAKHDDCANKLVSPSVE